MQPSGFSGSPQQKSKRHKKSNPTETYTVDINHYQSFYPLASPLPLSTDTTSSNHNYPNSNYLQPNSSAVAAPSGFQGSSVFDPGAFQGYQNPNSNFPLTPQESSLPNSSFNQQGYQYSEAYGSTAQIPITQPFVSPTFGTHNDRGNENQHSVNCYQVAPALPNYSIPPGYNINYDFLSTYPIPPGHESKTINPSTGTATTSEFNQIVTNSKTAESSSSKKFICSECGKQLTRKESLNNHFNSKHLKLKPHKCTNPECEGKCFTTKSDLRRHKRETHEHQTKQFVCYGELDGGKKKWGCGRTFYRRSQLKNHWKGPRSQANCGIPDGFDYVPKSIDMIHMKDIKKT
ncbi:unnamed protein product [Ambrosiozyma monospora]|uniref:Unnamed protein product n=1 Tax=Ambrosiozyma monospora TaxID=43982 RepID=A0A9W7DIQ6_AMBMO|nr:unnamed protein product [Ambrosiozyma monospora]